LSIFHSFFLKIPQVYFSRLRQFNVMAPVMMFCFVWGTAVENFLVVYVHVNSIFKAASLEGFFLENGRCFPSTSLR